MTTIIVENSITKERWRVAEFNVFGDAMICLDALSSKAPKELTYQVRTSLKVN